MKHYFIIGLVLLTVIKILGNGYLSMSVLHTDTLFAVASDCDNHHCEEIPMSTCLEHCMRTEPLTTGSSIPLAAIPLILFVFASIVLIPRVSHYHRRIFLFGSPPGLSFVRNTILRE